MRGEANIQPKKKVKINNNINTGQKSKVFNKVMPKKRPMQVKILLWQLLWATMPPSAAESPTTRT